MVEVSLINKEELEISRDRDPNAEKDIKFVAAPAIVKSAPPWSLAHELGIQPGDKILTVNDHKLRDHFDFQYHFEQSEEIELLVKRGKEEIIFEIEKDAEDEFGAEFETPLFNGVQECANDCPFCFVENQPYDKTRESLQYRDDDFRMSYLHGSYVTLTNLSFSDRKRIEALRPGPLYISVHATEIEVRNKMLGRKKSNPILDELKWLDSLGIPVHTQIVLCPGINDGKHLEKTIKDLYELKDSPVVSVAIVPVGLTKYHKRGLKRFTTDEAFDVVNMIESWEKENPKHKNFAFLSDEFYLMTHSPIPQQDYYGDYPQLEDGVGMTRLFLNEINEALKSIEKRDCGATLAMTAPPITVSWVNGKISQPCVEQVAKLINSKIPSLNLKPICIGSIFWGTTNVTGLLTGDDIYQNLKFVDKKTLGDAVIIPGVMLKDELNIFLDDMHIDELSEKLAVPCIKAWGAEQLLEALVDILSQAHHKGQLANPNLQSA